MMPSIRARRRHAKFEADCAYPGFAMPSEDACNGTVVERSSDVPRGSERPYSERPLQVAMSSFVWLTTGVKLRGPEGAQRLRATSASTSELCGLVSG